MRRLERGSSSTDAPPASVQHTPVALTQWISADYHRTFQIVARRPLLSPADREGMPDVAIVDEEFARRLFPGLPFTALIGHRVQLAGEGCRAREIVGVVRHIRHGALDELPSAEVYAPYWQLDPTWQLEIGRAMDVATRSVEDPSTVVVAVRR